MTDMCLPGQHVANMLADMLATRHKKAIGGGTASVGPTCLLLTYWRRVDRMSDVGMSKRGSKQQTCVHWADMSPTCCTSINQVEQLI
jgi:hypothetical protein